MYNWQQHLQNDWRLDEKLSNKMDIVTFRWCVGVPFDKKVYFSLMPICCLLSIHIYSSPHMDTGDDYVRQFILS